MNNLFKSIIDLSFPQIVKYLFWACDQDTGIFEELDSTSYLKFKRMSKYKKEEIQAINEKNDKDQELPSIVNEEEDEHGAMTAQTINQLLDINVEQNQKLREEQQEIKKIKANF